MRKILGLLLLPAFLGTHGVISTENEVELTQDQIYTMTGTTYGAYYTDIPQRPTVETKTAAFKNIQLTDLASSIEPGTALAIQSLHVNEKGLPVFQLKNGQFVAADKNIILEDSLLSQEFTKETKWLKKDFVLYEQPYLTSSKSKSSSLKPYSSVTISQIVRTRRGEFALIEGQGWVSMDFLVDKLNRMEQVQEFLSSRYQQPDFGIYVKDLISGKEAGVNQEVPTYSASVAKLPYLYYAEQQIRQGKVKLDQKLKYSPEVNEYKGAYDPEGSGSLPKFPDNKDYSLADVMSRVARESDNVAHNILGYYITNKSDETFQKTIDHIAGQHWDVESREVTPHMVGNVLDAIYEQGGSLVELMSQTNFDDQRISKNIDVQVAHKIGDAYDYKHDAAIVYGKRPFILVIFTNHKNYDSISQIANEIYEVLK